MRRVHWRNVTLCTIYREEFYSMYEFCKEILLWVGFLLRILPMKRVLGRNLTQETSSPEEFYSMYEFYEGVSLWARVLWRNLNYKTSSLEES